ncbi:hypothetical protein G7054_g1757 [Neopestalotiopsis clavispora]|nr:hypothetical protein G7054_g1757 [Neopestalotiopsis clavispora]
MAQPGGTPTSKGLWLVLRNELEEITDRRFNSVHEFRQQALDNWKIYKADFRNWLQRANTEISKLREAGRTDDADWLAEQLYDHRDTHNPATFNVVVLPANGRRETWRIIGESDPLPSEDTTSKEPEASVNREARHLEGTPGIPEPQQEYTPRCSSLATKTLLPDANKEVNTAAQILAIPHTAVNCVPENDTWDSEFSDPSRQLQIQAQTPSAAFGATDTSTQQWAPVLSQIQSTSEPVAVEVDTFGGESIMLSQVVEQKLWIGQSQSGKSFCLTCPCPAMLAPLDQEHRDTSEGTHHFVPRFFHFHPLVSGDALRHFRDVHSEVFVNIGDMLRKYGSESKQTPPPPQETALTDVCWEVIPDLKSTDTSNSQRERGIASSLQDLAPATQDWEESVSRETSLASVHSQRMHRHKVARIVKRRDMGRGGGGVCVQYMVHYAGALKGKWINIKQLVESKDMVETFDRENGRTTPWPVTQGGARK